MKIKLYKHIFVLLLSSSTFNALSVKEMCNWKETWKYRSLIAGGMDGAAFNATHVPDNRAVAIKEQFLGKKFELEVKAYSELKAKGFKAIPQVYDFWQCDGKGYIAMQKLNKCFDRRVTFKQIETFIRRVKEIATSLNDTGWAHIDLHEGNVMCDPTTRAIKFIDFGRASKVEPGDKFIIQFQNNKIGEMRQNLLVKVRSATPLMRFRSPSPGSSGSGSPGEKERREQLKKQKEARSRSRDKKDAKKINPRARPSEVERSKRDAPASSSTVD